MDKLILVSVHFRGAYHAIFAPWSQRHAARAHLLRVLNVGTCCVGFM